MDLSRALDLSGRHAVVTGGAGHVGRVAADALGQLGARITILDLPAADPGSAADQVAEAHGIEASGLPVDLADADALRVAAQSLAQERCEILVHSAALVGTSDLHGWAGPFDAQSEEAWQKAMQVNLTSFFTLSRILAPSLGGAGRGSIITIGSIYGGLGPDWSLYEGTDMANPAAYAASKGGLKQFTRWLGTTLAPDVRANMITPGGIERGQPEVFQRRYIARTPMARMGTEGDLAGAIAYLASDLSAYVTGQELMVDGGYSAW